MLRPQLRADSVDGVYYGSHDEGCELESGLSSHRDGEIEGNWNLSQRLRLEKGEDMAVGEK